MNKKSSASKIGTYHMNHTSTTVLHADWQIMYELYLLSGCTQVLYLLKPLNKSAHGAKKTKFLKAGLIKSAAQKLICDQNVTIVYLIFNLCNASKWA